MYHFSIYNSSRGAGGGGGDGGREKAFFRRRPLKEGGVHKHFLIIGGAFIGGRRLKEGGRLLEDFLYRKTA